MPECALLLFALAAASPTPAPPAAPPAPAAPSDQNHDATVHHAFDDVAKWVGVFDDPGRDAWQKPDAVIDAIGVKPGMTVADLGAGTGYFSVHLAKAVGDKGLVLAIDIEPNFIKYLQERAEKAQIAQLVPLLADPADPRLPPHGVDIVLIVNTWHHIDDRLQYILTLAAGLKPGGRVAVVDFKKGEFPVGPPDVHKMSAERVTSEFATVGWKLASHWDELPYQYVLVFTPPAASGGGSGSQSTDPRAKGGVDSASGAPSAPRDRSGSKNF